MNKIRSIAKYSIYGKGVSPYCIEDLFRIAENDFTIVNNALVMVLNKDITFDDWMNKQKNAPHFLLK